MKQNCRDRDRKRPPEEGPVRLGLVLDELLSALPGGDPRSPEPVRTLSAPISPSVPNHHQPVLSAV